VTVPQAETRDAIFEPSGTMWARAHAWFLLKLLFSVKAVAPVAAESLSSMNTMCNWEKTGLPKQSCFCLFIANAACLHPEQLPLVMAC